MKKITTILFLGVILILCSFYFVDKKNSKIKFIPIIQENKEVKKEITYSRVNFFLNSSNKASLAMPDYWEGNYRKKEEGNKVTFYFVRGVSDEVDLFSILFREKGLVRDNAEQEFIGQNDNFDFIFKKSEIFNLDDNVYYRMTEDINNLIKSFKVS
ncbi:MAG: hypothetical protein KAI79_13310 [Bacteroidales bacterium]|nr:hypothetical protein [Bacteroidales bacterium]